MADRVYSAVERASDQAVPERAAETPAENKIADFPAESLPPVLERMARGISELCGVPLEMSAPMVLATASISLGKGLRVRSLPGRVTTGNLLCSCAKRAAAAVA